jgi:hypothetical protein
LPVILTERSVAKSKACPERSRSGGAPKFVLFVQGRINNRFEYAVQAAEFAVQAARMKMQSGNRKWEVSSWEERKNKV